MKRLGAMLPNNGFHPTFLPPDLHLDFDIVSVRQKCG